MISPPPRSSAVSHASFEDVIEQAASTQPLGRWCHQFASQLPGCAVLARACRQRASGRPARCQANMSSWPFEPSGDRANRVLVVKA